MSDSDEQLLTENGWLVECESPFEIRHEESNSFATGLAADIVLDWFKQGDSLGHATKEEEDHRARG